MTRVGRVITKPNCIPAGYWNHVVIKECGWYRMATFEFEKMAYSDDGYFLGMSFKRVN